MTDSDKQSPNRGEMREAAVHVAVTVGFGLAALLVAWASDDGLRTALVVAAPILVLIGALGALFRTYRNWRAGGRWQIWQGASWFLLATFIMFLFSTGPVLVG